MRGKYIVPTRTCRLCSLLRFERKKWCFSRLSDQFKPIAVPQPVVLSTGSNGLCPYYCMTGPSHAACNVGRDLHFRLDRYRDAALLYITAVKIFHSTVATAAQLGRAQRLELEWVRRQLDPPATFSSILSQNVQLSTNDGAFARRVSSATCTTGERSLPQPPNPSSSHAPTSLTFGSKKNRRRQR